MQKRLENLPASIFWNFFISASKSRSKSAFLAISINSKDVDGRKEPKRLAMKANDATVKKPKKITPDPKPLSAERDFFVSSSFWALVRCDTLARKLKR